MTVMMITEILPYIFFKVGENKYYFLELLYDGKVDVIDCDCHTVLMTCRNLVSAKRWVSINLL